MFKRVGKKQKQLPFRLKTPTERNALLSKTRHERVTLALKQERLKCSQLEAEIMAENLDQAAPFMKLFWDQQQQIFSSKKKPL